MIAIANSDHAASPAPATIYSVLGRHARGSSSRKLSATATGSAAAALLILFLAPRWWILAALLAATAAYAGWGITAQRADRLPTDSRDALPLRIVMVACAAVGTAAAALFLFGLFLALFTGNARGTYGEDWCYRDGRWRDCSATARGASADTARRLDEYLR